MAISAEEQNFNERVANAPIVKEILDDLSGLKVGQAKLGEDMKSLEQKVDDGFTKITNAMTKLTDEIKSDKEKALLTSNKELKDALKKKEEKEEARENRKISNTDKVKTGSILGLASTVGYFLIERLGLFVG